MKRRSKGLGFGGFLSEFRLYLCNEWVAAIPSHAFRNFFYRKVMGFQIGPGAAILMHCRFGCARNFRLGAHSVINQCCRLDNRGGLFIGSNVSVSPDVAIWTADHDLNTSNFAGRCKAVHIGDFAWIGTRATILPGANLGLGCVVAAAALVSRPVAPYVVVSGIPAKQKSLRNKDINYELSYRRRFQ